MDEVYIVNQAVVEAGEWLAGLTGMSYHEVIETLRKRAKISLDSDRLNSAG